MELRYADVTKGCLQAESAFCTAVCPFHLDVRDFVAKIERGAFKAAYKVYRDAVCFPRIVEALCSRPCEEACPRAQIDGAIQLARLEKAAIGYAGDTAPNRYALPQKKQSIAIVGAGPSGLACALRLATRRYDVTVYDQSGRVGGHLWNILPASVFLAEIEEQFSRETVVWALDTQIHHLDDLAGYDAVYIATGHDGESFGLKLDAPGAYASGAPGIFIGGSLIGSDDASAIADGLRAVHAIERYLKTGGMAQPADSTETRMVLDPTALTEAKPVVLPANGAAYTQEEAAAEAGRCLRCACDACIRRCDLMTYYQKFPKRIVDEVAITIDPASLDGEETFAKRLMATCNQCGACAEGCPMGIDMGAFLLESRKAMHKKGKLPWAFYDFWLRDMRHAMGEEATLARLPLGSTPLSPDSQRDSYVFFPGCQLGASDPAYVMETYRQISAFLPDMGLWLTCCGAPAVWSGDTDLCTEIYDAMRRQWESLGKPALVYACPHCAQIMQDNLPEAESVFLYDLLRDMAEQGRFVPRQEENGKVYSIFDPCVSRDTPKLQDSVRYLVQAAGITSTPLPDAWALTRCCGWGGQVSIANPDYAKNVAERRIGLNALPFITYCVNCRDIFAEAGKEAVHLLDILFGIHDGKRRPPGISERQENRVALRRQALLTFWGEETASSETAYDEGHAPGKPKIHIEGALREKLAKDRILEEDAKSAVLWCEATGRTVTDADSGCLQGYAEIGRMTYWVEYRKLDDGDYALVNAYSHRMAIELEETWHGQRAKADM